MYCARKSARVKSYCYKQVIPRSLKHYSPEVCEVVLRKPNFPNYQLYNDIDKTYESFIQIVSAVIDNVAPSENKYIKNRFQDWCEG